MKKNITLFTSLIALSLAMTSGVYAGGPYADNQDGIPHFVSGASSPSDSPEGSPTKQKPSKIWRYTIGWFWGDGDEVNTMATVDQLQNSMESLSIENKGGWSTKCVAMINEFLAANEYSEEAVGLLLDGWFGTSSYNSIRKNVLTEVKTHRALNKREGNTLAYATRTVNAAKKRG